MKARNIQRPMRNLVKVPRRSLLVCAVQGFLGGLFWFGCGIALIGSLAFWFDLAFIEEYRRYYMHFLVFGTIGTSAFIAGRQARLKGFWLGLSVAAVYGILFFLLNIGLDTLLPLTVWCNRWAAFLCLGALGGFLGEKL